MADTKKPAAKKPAAKPAAKAKAAPAAKAPVAKKAATPKRAVARPVTRAVVRKEATPRADRVEKQKTPRAPRAELKPLPTAPAGQASLITADGSISGAVELPAALVGSTKRSTVLFQALTAAAANARQATSATKNRSRVAGGGAKPWAQKGTGRARQGSTRSPHWRHGAVVFGPNGRRYEQRMPEKMRRAAFSQAFASRIAEGRVLVAERFSVAGNGPRTREVVDWLARVGDVGRTLIVAPSLEAGFASGAANVRTITLRTPGSVQLVEVLTHDTVLVERPALDALAYRAGGAA